jgi:hypothetical protein
VDHFPAEVRRDVIFGVSTETDHHSFKFPDPCPISRVRLRVWPIKEVSDDKRDKVLWRGSVRRWTCAGNSSSRRDGGTIVLSDLNYRRSWLNDVGHGILGYFYAFRKYLVTEKNNADKTIAVTRRDSVAWI